jgi:hypothetical protein
MLAKVQKEHQALIAKKSPRELEKYNFDIYTTKYGYIDAVNKTKHEIEKAKEATKRSQERRYSQSDHGVIKNWTETDYFRVFYGKDHAGTQTDREKSLRTISRGVCTEDGNWEELAQSNYQKYSRTISKYYETEFVKLEAAYKEKRLQIAEVCQEKLSKMKPELKDVKIEKSKNFKVRNSKFELKSQTTKIESIEIKPRAKDEKVENHKIPQKSKQASVVKEKNLIIVPPAKLEPIMVNSKQAKEYLGNKTWEDVFISLSHILNIAIYGETKQKTFFELYTSR